MKNIFTFPKKCFIMNFHGRLLTKKTHKTNTRLEETRGHPGLKQMLSKMVVARRRGMVDVDFIPSDKSAHDDDDDDDDYYYYYYIEYIDVHVDYDNYLGYDYTSLVLILANQTTTVEPPPRLRTPLGRGKNGMA